MMTNAAMLATGLVLLGLYITVVVTFRDETARQLASTLGFCGGFLITLSLLEMYSDRKDKTR